MSSVPSFFICPTPDLDSSAPLELPYSLDFLPCFYSSFLASRRGFPCITFHACSSRACCLPSSSFVWHPSCRGIQPGDTEACVALAKEIGLFLRRSIEGGKRGVSGRNRLRLQSRLYVALSDSSGQLYPEPRVFHSLRDLRAAVFSRGNPGTATFIGFASVGPEGNQKRMLGLGPPGLGDS